MELTYDISELERVADKIIEAAKTKVLLFYGPMGAGKTTLIKHLVKKLGSADEASSPTFSLVNEYEGEEGPIFHFDFYRIEEENEALDIGIEDYFDQDAWILIEWPQKISKFLPYNAAKVEISVIGETTRNVKVLLTN